MMDVENMISKENIKYCLYLLGINKGDIVFVHSALSSIGFVDGGAETVIDALLESVGDEGTIIMPALTNWDSSFDSLTSPSVVGKISETFRKRKNALRSLHPVHSVTAIGKNASYIVDNHDKCETGCGIGTPYMKIHELDGKIMLLGVDMDRNTFIHTIETEINAKYLLTIDIPAPTYLGDWQNKRIELNKFPSGHRDFISLTASLRKNNVIIEGMIGNAVVKVMRAQNLFEAGVKLLKNDPLHFICNNTNCNFCYNAREIYSSKKPTNDLINRCCDSNCEICAIMTN